MVYTTPIKPASRRRQFRTEKNGFMRPSPSTLGLALATLIWTTGLAVGFWWLMSYKETYGAEGLVPDTIADHDDEKLVLKMFVHPRCPCTRASLTELAWVLDRVKNDVVCEVVFVRPPGVPEGWERGGLWNDVLSMPGVRAHVDESGLLAKAHGATTSGHVVLVDRSGKVLFSGGITGLRGHVGDNAGRQSLLARLQPGAPKSESHVVFGCPVLNSSGE
jgi:hypothetical protein